MLLKKRQHRRIEFLMECHSIEPGMILAKPREFRRELR